MVQDPVDFIEENVKVCVDGHAHGVLLDDAMAEMVRSLDDQEKVIGRYPRRYGKTTALAGYVLYKLMSSRRTNIAYITSNTMTGIRFLQSLAYAYHQMPHDKKCDRATENSEYFQVGDSKVMVFGSPDSWRWDGGDWALSIYDDVKSLREDSIRQHSSFVHKIHRVGVVGTFPLDSDMGKMWLREDEVESWTTLPSSKERWKVDTVLSLCNPVFRRDY